ncbi:MAG: ATP-binding protein [Nitrospirota bacterium]
MLTASIHSASKIADKVRQTASQWWGGIGCRVAFFMSLAIFLVVALIGVFMLWEGRRAQDAEMRSKAFTIANYLSRLAAADIIAENQFELYRKTIPAFVTGDGSDKEQDLVYLVVYNRNGQLLFGKTPEGIITATDPEERPGQDRAAAVPRRIDVGSPASSGPRFLRLTDNIYDLTLPVFVDEISVGFVKVGISAQRVQQRFGIFATKTISLVVIVLLLGLLFSQIIAAGINKPITRLNAAIDELGRQNWKTPIPIQGRDELSRMANAFNQMALALKERETSLSRGNRDLFLLHTAGLDLMESLDLDALLGKIASRAADLVKADTTTVAAVDRNTRTLQYLGVTGGKARALKELSMPLEAGGIFNWIASYGTPLLIQDAQADFRLDAAQMKALGIRSLISIPLWSSNTMMAILSVVNKKGGDGFDKQDLRLFTVYSNLAGAALQNAFLYADLKHKINELSSTQQQLVHSTKMAAIGELAANVAHEINNPLTSVLGYTSHLLKTLDVPEESRQKLRTIEQETLRVRKIIRNLLDFSRQRASRMQQGDLLQPLRETVSLLRGAADGAAVRIIEDYPESPVIVRMDHDEIKQVFINLMNNALHAMPSGGELRVRVDAGRDNERGVEFSDTGHGIPGEHLGKIFEPFFSTKGNGDGTGLGLSISYRIVQNHGGRIEVESDVGRGSIFRVVLPLQKNAMVKELNHEATR